MRLTDYDKLQLKLREYADRKASNGEIELANGILKAKCFIDQECEVFDEQQLNDGWIPVSERLPENDSHVLVSFDDGFVATVDYVDNDFELWYGSGEPIAWMDVPEPYNDGGKL